MPYKELQRIKNPLDRYKHKFLQEILESTSDFPSLEEREEHTTYFGTNRHLYQMKQPPNLGDLLVLLDL